MFRQKNSDRLMVAASQKLKERDYWLEKLSGELTASSFPYYPPPPAVKAADLSLRRPGGFFEKSPPGPPKNFLSGDRRRFGLESDLESAPTSIDSLRSRAPGPSQNFLLTDELGERLIRLSNHGDPRLHMILVASLAALLHKYNGQTDIIVGSPIYKQEADIEFINTVLPLRCRVLPGMTFKDLLLQVKQTIVEAVEHQNYPMEVLLDQLHLLSPQDPDGDFPLFDVMAILENIQDSKYVRHIQTNIVFSFLRVEKGVQGTIRYNPLKFDEAGIRRMAGHLTALLGQVLFQVEVKLSETTILSPGEKQQILFRFNDTRREIPRDKPYHRLFEEQAARRPDRAAALDSQHQITYGRLNEEANGIAAFLLSRQVGDNTIAAIYMERGLNMLAAILGVFKAGGAYLGIDADYPEERVRVILEDSEARVLITEPGNLQGTGPFNQNLPHLHAFLELGPGRNTNPGRENPGQDVSTDNLAYLIYTSGTTGKPKGVMIHQLGMLNHLYANIDFLAITEQDILAQTASLSFDISVWQFLAAIILGGVTYIIDSEVILEASRLIRTLQKGKITILEAVPSLMKAFLAMIAQEGHQELKALRWMIPTGETLSPALAGEWYRHYPGIRLVNAYGPAEASDDVTLWVIEPAALETCNSIPVGKPLQNLHIYIMDPDLSLCPVHVPGEICIAGLGVGKGYLKDPQKTAAAFQPNPYREEIGTADYSTLYKTGDMGYFLEDGNVMFLGRKDYQVKVRGFRIELEEIESQLLTMTEIKETVVVARGETSDRYLCAYIIPEPGARAGLTAAQVREYLSARLPYYMVPSYFMFLERLPLTPNGKIDRKALPDPELAAGDEYIAPRNELEEKLAELCAEVLETEPGNIGIDASFFELGGHSLKAILLAAKIHKTFEVKIPLAEIFNLQTVRGFGQYIENHTRETYEPVKPVEKMEYCKLSSAQKRMYILQQMDPAGTAYNLGEIRVINDTVDKEKLAETFKTLIHRHESLRTSFTIIDREPVQRVHETVAFALQHRVAPPGTASETGAFIRRLPQPFDLARAPLLVVRLIEIHPRQHVLMVDLHHIISDGTSHDILLREYLALYGGEELPPLKLQYKDCARWQNSAGQQERVKKQENYWLKQFTGEIPLLNLPLDHTRPEIQSFAGSVVEFRFSGEETASLKQLADRQGVTLYMLLLAIYTLFLARVGAQEDIVVGTDVAGRNHEDLQQIIGLFVNTLALRNFPAAAKTCRDFLAEVKERTLQAFENQDYQFETLVDRLAVRKDPSRNPLFDVMFSFMELETGPEDGNEAPDPGTSIQADVPAKFDLTLNGMAMGGRLWLSFSYCTRLFQEETIRRLVTYFRQAVFSLLADPDQETRAVRILPSEEQERLLVDFNDNKAAFSRDKTVYQWVEDRARQAPGTTAVVCKAHHLTYGALTARVDQLVKPLRGSGTGEDQPVGILLARSPLLVESILAVWKAGGAYIPLDTAYPQQRITAILSDSRARVLIAAPDRIDTGPGLETAADTVLIPWDYPGKTLVDPGEPARSEPAVRMNTLSYVIYTSGSTGGPKGAMVEHIGMMNHIQAKINDLRLTESSILVQNASHTFDISVWQFFTPLLLGGRTVIYPDEVVLDPPLFLSRLAKDRVTVLEVVPSYLAVMLELAAAGSWPGKSLDYLLVTGETLKPQLVKQWFACCPGIKIVNAYGPTEASDDITHWIMDRVPADDKIPIGKPLQNLNIYILDPWLRLCPLGIKGEICVSGAGVGRGYLNNPELTVEKFIFNRSYKSSRTYISKNKTLSPQITLNTPQSPLLYKTGDLGRWLPDGTIEFFGRKDFQVKIRGFRIELEEIEMHLARHPGVKEAVVMVKETGGREGEKYLCAYLEAAAGQSLEPPALKEYLARRLPAYMIPDNLVLLEQIPLTPNGKVDRNALVRWDDGFYLEKEYSAPRDLVEAKLASIWAEVLGIGIEKIGIEANFFDLGGHSLNATIMVARVHKALNVKLPLAKVFVHPVLKGMARAIKGAAQDRYFAIEPVEKKEYYRLSSAQKRMYVVQQMGTGMTSYNISTVVVLKGKLVPRGLEKAFKHLVNRHESLRTSFIKLQDEAVQRVHHDLDFAAAYYRGSEAEAEEIVRNFIRPFDLGKAPLLRVGVIEIDETRHIFMVDMHHIISDGASHEILVADFAALYDQQELFPLRIHYKDFSEWQNLWVREGKMKRQEEYWSGRFKGGDVPVLNMRLDYPRPPVRNVAAGAHLNFSLPDRLYGKVLEVAGQTGATVYMVLLAGYYILLARYTKQEDIVVGSLITGRSHADLQRVIGMFVNLIALRNYPQKNKTFRQFLGEVKENALQAYENQDYQFEELVMALGLQGGFQRNPLFDTVFTYDNIKKVEENTGLGNYSTHLEPYEHQADFAKFDLYFLVAEFNETINILLRYSTQLFKLSTIRRIVKYYLEIMELVMADIDVTLKDLRFSHDFLIVAPTVPKEDDGDFKLM